MPDFKVTGVVHYRVDTTVEADTLEEAQDIVDDWDISDFGLDDNDADIDVEVVER